MAGRYVGLLAHDLQRLTRQNSSALVHDMRLLSKITVKCCLLKLFHLHLDKFYSYSFSPLITTRKIHFTD